jgi:adenylosuccinate lyase
MLARYTSDAMAAVWSAQHKIELWHRVETAVIDGYCAEGIFPPEIAELAAEAEPPTWERVLECEAETAHDVAAFLQAWAGGLPDALGSRIHRGLTSSDVVDTALAIQLAETSAILQARVDALVSVLRDHALAHLDVLRIGRTHGQHATQDSWGHRIADFAAATARARRRFVAAAEAIAVGKISGPTGTHESVPLAVEQRALSALGLHRSEVSTQIVLRDRIASWMCEVAQLATLCEAVATEVRLGQLSEISEVRESVGPAQVGSSAMPHKRNPIRAEKICGLARVVRGYVIPVLDDVVSWQQRDISHSSVERICLPDAAAAAEHVLAQTATLVTGLAVDVDRMASNLAAAGTAPYTHQAIVALSDDGVPYLAAHRIVTGAVGAADPADLIGAIVKAAAAIGITVDAERLGERLTLAAPDFADVRAHLESL